ACRGRHRRRRGGAGVGRVGDDGAGAGPLGVGAGARSARRAAHRRAVGREGRTARDDGRLPVVPAEPRPRVLASRGAGARMVVRRPGVGRRVVRGGDLRAARPAGPRRGTAGPGRGILGGRVELEMKAVIMAGGEGTRLRPLTSNQPKPMISLANRPMMEHIVRLLKEHGFDDIVVTVAFMPHAIRTYFGDGSEFGVRMVYATEETPLGTAGSVRNARDE